MKWTGMAALALVLAAAGLARATEPNPAAIRMTNPRGPLYSAANWWARYGEPVNHDALSAAPAQAAVEPAGASQHGDGYVYGPGSCDYTPPCTGWQWNDYCPMPLRCYPLSMRWQDHRACRGGGQCSECCGHGDKHGDCGCSAPSCAAPTCAAPSCAAPSCEAAPACGCESSCGGKFSHCHWSWKSKGCWHNHCGCDTCAPSCGCAAPVVEVPAGDAPPKPMPDASAKAAMHTDGQLVWPFGPVR